MEEPQGLLVVYSEPVIGHEDEYHDWYSNHHLRHVVGLPGFVSGQRFRLGSVQRLKDNPAPPRQFLSLYEMVGDPAEAFATMNAELAKGTLPVSDAMNPNRFSHYWQAITPKVT